MRNPSRIYPLLNKLGDIWCLNPDLRFGQLVEVIKAKNKKTNLFNIEDEEFEKLLDSFRKDMYKKSIL